MRFKPSTFLVLRRFCCYTSIPTLCRFRVPIHRERLEVHKLQIEVDVNDCYRLVAFS